MKKINFVDILIILVIIVVAVVASISVISLRDENYDVKIMPANNETKTIKFEVMYEKSEDYLIDELNKQTEIYSLDTNESMGKVIDIRVEDHYVNVVDSATGKVVKVKSTEYKDLYMTVEADAIELGNGKFKIGSTEIFSTKLINVKGTYFSDTAKIWRILEVK